MRLRVLCPLAACTILALTWRNANLQRASGEEPGSAPARTGAPDAVLRLLDTLSRLDSTIAYVGEFERATWDVPLPAFLLARVEQALLLAPVGEPGSSSRTPALIPQLLSASALEGRSVATSQTSLAVFSSRAIDCERTVGSPLVETSRGVLRASEYSLMYKGDNRVLQLTRPDNFIRHDVPAVLGPLPLDDATIHSMRVAYEWSYRPETEALGTPGHWAGHLVGRPLPAIEIMVARAGSPIPLGCTVRHPGGDVVRMRCTWAQTSAGVAWPTHTLRLRTTSDNLTVEESRLSEVRFDVREHEVRLRVPPDTRLTDHRTQSTRVHDMVRSAWPQEARTWIQDVSDR